MANLSSCLPFNAGTFSTTSQTSLATNSVINLTQQVLAGTSISFTPPNTINLKPGNYMAIYFLMGRPTNAGLLTAVGLQLNSVIITQSTIGYSSNGNATAYPFAQGTFFFTTTNVNSTLQLIARSPIVYDQAAINAALTAANAQTAQLSIIKL